MLCPCGRQLNTTDSSYQFRRFGENGEITYAICVHGHVVIDIEKIEEIKPDVHKLIKDADLKGELDDESIDS